tara:strand:+ start:182 stop:568 length:387 start_codon:yes stop_codon:yes gene_type:complete
MEKTDMFFVYLLIVSVVFYCSQNKLLGGFPQLLEMNISKKVTLLLVFILTLLVILNNITEGFYGWIPISTRLINPTANMSYDLRGEPIHFKQSNPPYVNRNYFGPFIYRLFPFIPPWYTSPKHPFLMH